MGESICLYGGSGFLAQKHKLGPGSRFTPANRAQDLLRIQKPGKPNLNKKYNDTYCLTYVIPFTYLTYLNIVYIFFC